MYFNLYCIENNAIIKTWELVRNFQNTVINVNKSELSIFLSQTRRHLIMLMMSVIGFLRQRKMKSCKRKNKTKTSM